MFQLSDIDKDWTLFLDRDGVLNEEKKASYIFNWNEFHFYKGVLDALAIFNKIFNKIVVVTNQKGIGKQLMTEEDLLNIHQKMIASIEASGGRIDKVYFCADLSDDSPNRKPNAGMALKAKQDFPEINFTKSIMVGNKLSDMNFGRNAGMHTIFVATTNPETPFPHSAIDKRYNHLEAFAKALIKT